MNINKDNYFKFCSVVRNIGFIFENLKDIEGCDSVFKKLKEVSDEVSQEISKYEKNLLEETLNGITEGQIYKFLSDTDAVSIWTYTYVRIVSVTPIRIDFETIEVTKGDYIQGITLDVDLSSRKEDFLHRTGMEGVRYELCAQEEWDKYINLIESLKKL